MIELPSQSVLRQISWEPAPFQNQQKSGRKQKAAAPYITGGSK